MVRYGFIHTKEDIKFLVLFAMDLLPFPVIFSTIVDLTTWCDEGFGYFELSEAFYEMVPTGHIEEKPCTPSPKKDARLPAFSRSSFPIRSAKPHSALRCVSSARSGATPASTPPSPSTARTT